MKMWLIGVLLLAESTVAVVWLVQIWPTMELIAADADEQAVQEAEAQAAPGPEAFVIRKPATWRNSPETAYLLLVAVAATLGAVLHAAVSFARHAGAATFSETWAWWYVLRPFSGVALALLVFLAIRGGLLSTTFGSAALSPSGVAALAGLTGFFARHTIDKLEEVVKTLFGATGTGAAAPSATGATPVISGIDPAAVPAGSSDTTVAVSGANFVEGTFVEADGQELPTEFQGAGALTAMLDAAALARPRSVRLVAVNPGLAGGRSHPKNLSVTRV